MNLLSWIVVLAGGAVLGGTFASALAGATLSSLGGAALFPFAAIVVRLMFWMISRVR